MPTCLSTPAVAVWAAANAAVGAAGALHKSVRDFRIYVYPLPDCSFDHMDPEDIDGSKVERWHPGRPPSLPIHRKIALGKYATNDPENASFFYIPAPFALWDNSGDNTNDEDRCPTAVHIANASAVIGISSHLLSAVIPVENVSTWAVGDAPRSLSLWIRNVIRPGTSSWSGALLSTGVDIQENGYYLGLWNGCPILSACVEGPEACGQKHWAQCSQSGLADGDWHSLMAIYDEGVSSIYVDDVLLGSQPVAFNTTAGPIYYGDSILMHIQGGPEAIGLTDRHHNNSDFRWEVHGVQLYDTAMPFARLKSCRMSRIDRSPHSDCFRMIRNYVEAQPWVHRHNGLDHMALIGGADYPGHFNPTHPPREEDYVLEREWPLFYNFVVLHFGARTERFLAWLLDGTFADQARKESDKWLHRVFQTVTIPPLFEDERFDPEEMRSRMSEPRSVRLAYRGLSYGAMVERCAVQAALTEHEISLLQSSGRFQVEFTNWTHELLQGGVCKTAFAFDGLCPWSVVGRSFASDTDAKAKGSHGFGRTRMMGMKKRSLELWATSEFCLVLPGDGGYELRLYSMMNLGCIPVIVYAPGTSLPKIPFSKQLPWHRFAIFWSLSFEYVEPPRYNQFMWLSAHQMLFQLAALDPDVIAKKRAALLRYAPGLGWHDDRGAGSQQWGPNRRTALDLLAGELQYRARKLVGPPSWHRGWMRWKVPDLDFSIREDVSGNGCPLGYPVCASYAADPNHGDMCFTVTSGIRSGCPVGCERRPERPFCVAVARGGKDAKPMPCRAPLCWKNPKVLVPEYATLPYGGWGLLYRRPRLALLTYSPNPELAALTRPSLQRFHATHADRYDLIVEEEPLLDPRVYAPSWNKLAFLRRALIVGKYDVVVWVGDGILITNTARDPIFEALERSLLRLDIDKTVLASLDVRVDKRVPLNVGLLALKRGRKTLVMIDELFKIGWRRQLLDGRWLKPRNDGWYDQDAFGAYIRQHGQSSFEVVEHRVLQSIVRPTSSYWQPGDFAAHFTGYPAKEEAERERNENIVKFMRVNNFDILT